MVTVGLAKNVSLPSVMQLVFDLDVQAGDYNYQQ